MKVSQNWAQLAFPALILFGTQVAWAGCPEILRSVFPGVEAVESKCDYVETAEVSGHPYFEACLRFVLAKHSGSESMITDTLRMCSNRDTVISAGNANFPTCLNYLMANAAGVPLLALPEAVAYCSDRRTLTAVSHSGYRQCVDTLHSFARPLEQGQTFLPREFLSIEQSVMGCQRPDVLNYARDAGFRRCLAFMLPLGMEAAERQASLNYCVDIDSRTSINESEPVQACIAREWRNASSGPTLIVAKCTGHPGSALERFMAWWRLQGRP